jgi:plasmid stability protein
MKSLHIRNLADEVVERLRRRVARHGRSAEAEPDFATLAAGLRRATRGRRHTPAEVLQRQGRRER